MDGVLDGSPRGRSLVLSQVSSEIPIYIYIYISRLCGGQKIQKSLTLSLLAPPFFYYDCFVLTTATTTYYRAVWVKLTGDDGRQSILTACTKLRKEPDKMDTKEIESSRPKNGQLVWLEMPKLHHFDEGTGTPLEKDGTTFDPCSARHLPWKER